MKTMNHAEYQAKARTMTANQLLYTIKDCMETLKGWVDCPNHGYYMDEIHYCRMELNRRQKAAA
jgi:hypothetical protein